MADPVTALRRFESALAKIQSDPCCQAVAEALRESWEQKSPNRDFLDRFLTHVQRIVLYG